MTPADPVTELAKSWDALNRAVSSMLVAQPDKMSAASAAVELAQKSHEELFARFLRSALTSAGASPAVARATLNAGRYETVRRLSAHAFAQLFEKNLKTGVPFDQLVDELSSQTDNSIGEDPSPTDVHPAIGTAAWMSIFEGDGAIRAQHYVDTHHKVIVVENTDAGVLQHSVAFENTNFWADSFVSATEANDYAEAWNTKCRAKTSF